MPRGKDSRDVRLAEETRRLLNKSRKEIRQLELSEKEARSNIRNFLAHLPQFSDSDSSGSRHGGPFDTQPEPQRAEK